MIDLPTIPDKRYFAIGEASELCGLPAHVLRYWEEEFPQLRPTKRSGNRRYYQLFDLEIIREIRSLLYEQGYTLDGARAQLALNVAKFKKTSNQDFTSPLFIKNVREIILELEDIQKLLEK